MIIHLPVSKALADAAELDNDWLIDVSQQHESISHPTRSVESSVVSAVDMRMRFAFLSPPLFYI